MFIIDDRSLDLVTREGVSVVMKKILLGPLLLSVFKLQSSTLLAQGSLTPPPGTPAPTMKTLDQVEPRTPISSIPYTISTPGSYYLTGNLTSGAAGISIDADDVTLDLNGFEISFSPGAGVYGVSIVNIHRNITVRNGSVRVPTGGVVAPASSCTQLLVENVRVDVSAGSGLGIYLGNNGIVTGCAVRGNSSAAGIHTGFSSKVVGCIVVGQSSGPSAYGIEVGDYSMVTGCTANSNGTAGIQGGRGCIVTDCVADVNAGFGIAVIDSSTITNCTARNNGTHGFNVGTGSTLTNCAAASNNVHGILTGTGSTLTNCTSGSNVADGISAGSGSTLTNCTAQDNTGDGIEAANNATIKNCTVATNSGNGIRASSNTLIQGCTARNNDGNGILAGDGCLISDSVANLNGKKPSLPVNAASDGIEISARNRVANCTLYDNAQHGINSTSANSRNYIEGCLLHSNDGFGIALQGNGNTVIKNQVGGNTGGTINQTGGNIGPIQSASDPVGTIHPLANFQ